jgi:nucleoside-diphosphate-sugar epimerase
LRVAIAGGHGKIALALASILRDRGDEVVSLIRNPGHEADVRAAGGEPAVCDLEDAETDAVSGAIGGAEAVVFAAGAGPGSGPERKWTMDYGGAVKLIAAAKEADIARYLIISSIGADPDAAGDDTFAVYRRAKGKADAELAASELDYTILRPSRLNDEEPTGLVALGESVRPVEIPRADVAAVVAESLRAEATIGRTLELTGGDVPVAEAVTALGG